MTKAAITSSPIPNHWLNTAAVYFNVDTVRMIQDKDEQGNTIYALLVEDADGSPLIIPTHRENALIEAGHGLLVYKQNKAQIAAVDKCLISTAAYRKQSH